MERDEASQQQHNETSQAAQYFQKYSHGWLTIPLWTHSFLGTVGTGAMPGAVCTTTPGANESSFATVTLVT